MGRPKAFVHIFRGADADRYRRDFVAGREPDEQPYGLQRASEWGFDVEFSRDPPRDATRRWEHAAQRHLGVDLAHALYNLDSMRDADVIWTMTEREAFAAATLITMGLLPRRPILGNVVWLGNDWLSMGRQRRAVYRFLVRHLSMLTVHSQTCLPALQSALPKARSELMHFGVNADSWRPAARESAPAGPLRIFSAGNDSTRDWDTLLAAFGNDERFQLEIACTWLSDDRAAEYRNLRMLRDPGMQDFQRAYADAQLVVVPMRENMFSGITAALDATVCGKPVLSSRTGGVPTYFDEEGVFYVPPGDAAALRDMALTTTADQRYARAVRAQERFIASDYSNRALARRYVEASLPLIAA